MLAALRALVSDNWTHRGQIWFLAVTELKKGVQGTWLGWVWLILKPVVFVAAFWFALEIGIKAGHSLPDGVHYVVWLAAGIFPWYYMSAMITQGSNVYRRYSYLVTKLKFPLPVISSFFSFAQLLIFLMTLGVLFLLMVIFRSPFTVYLVQLPLVIIFVYLTFTIFSVLTSPLSAVSKDFHNLLRVLNTPLFWLSGILFDVSQINIAWLQWVFAFNPVTFFASAFRASVTDSYWIWTEPLKIFPFLGVLVLLGVLALRVQSRLSREVPDVI